MRKKFVLVTMSLVLSVTCPVWATTPDTTETVSETEDYETLKLNYETLKKDYEELSKKYEEALAELEELKSKEADLPEYSISGTVNDITDTTFTVTTEKGNVYTFNFDNPELNVGEKVSFTYTGEISSADNIQTGTVSDLVVTAQAPAGAEYETGITYDNLSRNPDEYTGKLVKFSGKVIQLIEDPSEDEIQIRLAVDNDYDKVLLCGYDKSIVTSRVLEDDRITIYGMSVGLISYESTLGGTITIPAVYVTQIDQ